MNSILKTAFALLILVSANANAGHDDRALAGAVIGGIIGGIAGSQLSYGDERAALTIGGTVLGAVIGHELADDKDRGRHSDRRPRRDFDRHRGYDRRPGHRDERRDRWIGYSNKRPRGAYDDYPRTGVRIGYTSGGDHSHDRRWHTKYD